MEPTMFPGNIVSSCASFKTLERCQIGKFSSEAIQSLGTLSLTPSGDVTERRTKSATI